MAFFSNIMYPMLGEAGWSRWPEDLPMPRLPGPPGVEPIPMWPNEGKWPEGFITPLPLPRNFKPEPPTLYPLPRIQPGGGWNEGGFFPRTLPKLPGGGGGILPSIPKWPKIIPNPKFPWPFPDIPQRGAPDVPLQGSNTESWSGGSEPYKPNIGGRQITGPFAQQPLTIARQEDTVRPEGGDENDLLNQLLMSALMGQPEGGNQGSLGYGVGAQVPFGDEYRMRRDWEQDYRYV